VLAADGVGGLKVVIEELIVDVLRRARETEAVRRLVCSELLPVT